MNSKEKEIESNTIQIEIKLEYQSSMYPRSLWFNVQCIIEIRYNPLCNQNITLTKRDITMTALELEFKKVPWLSCLTPI